MTIKTYSNTYEEAFKAAIKAIKQCEFSIENLDERNGLITAKTSISLRSWGEEISIEVSETQDGVRISIGSAATSQLIDWGKSSDNIDKLFELIDIQLD